MDPNLNTLSEMEPSKSRDSYRSPQSSSSVAKTRKGALNNPTSTFASDSTSTNSDVLLYKPAIAGRRNRKRPQQDEDTRQSQASVPSVPGSFAICGNMNVDDIPSDSDEETENAEEIPPHLLESGLSTSDLFEAELVDPTERDQERLQIRREALQEVQSRAAKAEVVDDRAERERRRRMIMCLLVITCCSIIAAVVVTVVLVTQEGDTKIVQVPATREEQVEEAIDVLFGDNIGLDVMNSSQYKAFEWMAANDTTITFPIETAEQRQRFRQRFALCILAFATSIRAWEDQELWLKPISECGWGGLICDTNERLVGISRVAIKNLAGTLPTEIGVLTDLKYLFIQENLKLGGTLPSELAKMVNLVSFYGQDDSFSGTLPDEYRYLSALENFNLASNRLTGTIGMEISHMHEAREIDFSYNGFSSSIASHVWRLQSLRSLRVQGNTLNGTIPADLGDLAELRELWLQENEFEGVIPTELGFLPRLNSFRAFANLLTGSVPASLCAKRAEPALASLRVLEMDCAVEVNCTCCTKCY